MENKLKFLLSVCVFSVTIMMVNILLKEDYSNIHRNINLICYFAMSAVTAYYIGGNKIKNQ